LIKFDAINISRTPDRQLLKPYKEGQERAEFNSDIKAELDNLKRCIDKNRELWVRSFSKCNKAGDTTAARPRAHRIRDIGNDLEARLGAQTWKYLSYDDVTRIAISYGYQKSPKYVLRPSFNFSRLTFTFSKVCI
jgi:hypothetical protein